ncbi:MAG: polysaccharide pyruvyl transferase CsaB [Megasphaera sp.]|jgi:polysaccharide pyruvyl transferase CsaB|nr:polysaccharide pyruvyl transferase CsaB [Megasphaera sp.]MCH4188251.1 polysaccharide pyruvyl transferase CsaB [Megasphaera sp.]MCH4217311.1 polysaccharide pyruvyl transferase CsaB [Megasphaera sp.]
MTNIVISGYYGFANAGDEAMLSAIIGSLQDAIPDVAITVITGNCRMTRMNHHVHTIHRLNLAGIAVALRRCDILISGGGSLLQDVTSERSLYYYLLIMRMALFFHKPVMLYAQGIGPVRGHKARKAVRDVLQRVAVIGVRDSESKTELASMGVTAPPIHVTADAVLSMHPVDKQIGFYLLKKAGVTGISTRVGIAVRNWQGMTAYKEAIASAADELQRTTGCRIIFIPMQYPADVEAGEDIAKRMKTEAVVLRASYSTVEFMSLIGCMDAVIANRLHALIFASIMQVPITALSYDPKIDSFVRLIGEHLAGTVEAVQADDITADVKRKLALGRVDPEVQAHLNHLRRQSMRNAYLALRVLEGKAGLRARLTKHTKDQQ